MRWKLAALLCLTLMTACYRTHYMNFSPANPNRAPQQAAPVKAGRAWQHFFIYGWVPSALPIDARGACGRAENVHSIETRRTFLEGLVAAFAGYFINIYSPWNAAVYCRESAMTLAPAAAPAPATPSQPVAPPTGAPPPPEPGASTEAVPAPAVR
jgi:hypothetical protein